MEVATLAHIQDSTYGCIHYVRPPNYTGYCTPPPVPQFVVVIFPTMWSPTPRCGRLGHGGGEAVVMAVLQGDPWLRDP
eukprot:COSAG04_NODE_3285_length_2973_cov_3.607168_3_plen_78_part_00